jgi:hypothetical protein
MYYKRASLCSLCREEELAKTIYQLQTVDPRYRTAFKIPPVSSVILVGEPQPSPFKYLAINTMRHLVKIHSFLPPH